MAAKEEVYVAVEARPAPAVAESGESEYETDSDDDYDEEEEREILKPVFVPRAKRETILERERKLAEEDAVLEKKHLEQEERKKQTRVMVAESVRRLDDKSVQDAATDADSDAGLPDDTDGVDNEQEVTSTVQYSEVTV
jgi:microfibrillar-associated protein 1